MSGWDEATEPVSDAYVALLGLEQGQTALSWDPVAKAYVRTSLPRPPTPDPYLLPGALPATPFILATGGSPQ